MNWGEKRYNTFYKETVHFGDDRVVRFIKKKHVVVDSEGWIVT